MLIKLWGIRGSVPTPISNQEYQKKIHDILIQFLRSENQTVNHIQDFIRNLPEELQFVNGGNTTCATVTSHSGSLYVIDAGTGIRQFGEELLANQAGKGPITITLFITHTHWDHIQGLPFFKPLYVPSTTIRFVSPYPDLEDRLKKQNDPLFFPVLFEETGAKKEFLVIEPGKPMDLESGLIVDCHPLAHPGGSFAYRFREAEKTFIFATDAEFTGEALEDTETENEFFRDADLLVLDSQYTLNESFMKFEWGHTCYTVAVNCGARWNAKRLVLFHLEPTYSDAKLKRIEASAREHLKKLGAQLPYIYIARESQSFKL